MKPEEIKAVALEFSQAFDALQKSVDDIVAKVGLISARSTRIETRQARLLEHVGLTHDGHPRVEEPQPQPPSPPTKTGAWTPFKPPVKPASPVGGVDP